MCLPERCTDSRARPPALSRIARRTRPLRRSALSRRGFIVPLPSLLLAFLAEDILAGIPDALALVRLGRPIAANLGGHLADLLLVDAGHHDLGRLRRRDRNALRDRIDDLVAVAELKLQILALHGGAIADAGDLEPALEPLGHAGDHVGEQRPHGAPHGARALAVVGRVDLDGAALHLDGDIVVQRELQGAFRALDAQALARHVGGDAGRDRDWFLADA